MIMGMFSNRSVAVSLIRTCYPRGSYNSVYEYCDAVYLTNTALLLGVLRHTHMFSSMVIK